MWACLSNSVGVVNFFCPVERTVIQETLLDKRLSSFHACRRDTLEVLEFLTRKGVRIRDIHSEGFPALGAGNMYLLQVLIGSLDFFASAVINQSDYFGFGFTTLK